MLKAVLSIGFTIAALTGAANAQDCKAPAMPAAHLVDAGKYQMAVNPQLPPQTFINDKGELLGLNVELTTAMAKIMCLEPVFIRMDTQGMLPGLQGGRFDMVNNGLFWTEERAKILVMVPFAQQGFSVLTTADSPLAIKSLDDLAGLHVASELGSFPHRMLMQTAAAQAAKGAKPIDIHVFNNGADWRRPRPTRLPNCAPTGPMTGCSTNSA
jgi:polar amino acid transport system substrate-binding protein